jgi:hypothetical protein
VRDVDEIELSARHEFPVQDVPRDRIDLSLTLIERRPASLAAGSDVRRIATTR